MPDGMEVIEVDPEMLIERVSVEVPCVRMQVRPKPDGKVYKEV